LQPQIYLNLLNIFDNRGLDAPPSVQTVADPAVRHASRVYWKLAETNAGVWAPAF
jgi:hypothetical protein